MTGALFSPITYRGLTLPDRVVVSPLWQSNSENRPAMDWHLMRLIFLPLSSAALVMTGMTDVKAVGRISFKCAGKEGEKWIA